MLKASAYVLLPPPRPGEKYHLTTLKRDSRRANPASCIYYVNMLNKFNRHAASTAAVAVTQLNFRPARLKAARMGRWAGSCARVRAPSARVVPGEGEAFAGAQPFPPPPLYFRRTRAGLAQSK